LLEKLISTLENYRKPESRIVLALSGGMDSRVLLALLANIKALDHNLKCIAVHINHGLSPHAQEWAEKCESWCIDYGIEFALENVELVIGGQISIEHEARNKRYEALNKYVSKNDLLITGQHSNDQLETFLLAMKRGSGPKGLSSMPLCSSFGDGFLVRPLLEVTREKIQEYALAHRLEWVEDESNQDTQFDRNFLRQVVIPALIGRWPSIEQSVSRTAKLCADQEQLLEELLQERLQTFTDLDGGLSIADLELQSVLARNQLLRLWLKNQQCVMPSMAQLALIWQEVALARRDANPIINLTSGQVRRFKERLYFIGKISDVSTWSATLSSDERVELPDNLGHIRYICKHGESKSGLRAPLDDERVWIHFSPQGITAHPAGRAHSRKLKKLYQEYGVPSWLRNRTPLVMYGDSLAMVVGLFVCKEFQGDDCEILWDKV
jgi:tRNA(Ile)-lysidine synthase